ncbi:HAMP domain-containing sensor histidine kinase [Bacteriovorax sp. PP10]|uniref:histidine kinase n=1 Tax=Bacteriovorax antarcticus TaxID=3088717 RepID=A0ABU5VVP1_9BACT|nr:HAMP domain-containing sensor histidine kinase [Bacteriovorax sp. PP10]MEA9356672.1 HAMP domain-containing sensor histidine kinase [Bacteriovorax sp. PP10]
MKSVTIALTKQSKIAKARYVRPFTYCLVTLSAYFTIIYFIRYESKVLAFSCFFALICSILIPYALKYTKSHTFIANYIVTIYFITVQMLTLYTGGIKASSIWWLGMVPVLAAFLLNAYYSVIWFLIMGSNVAIIMLLKQYDMLPESVIPSSGVDQFLNTSTIFGITMLTALCVLTDILREKTSSENEQLLGKSFRLSQLASLGKLATGVAHEINNPLAVIRGSQLKINRMIASEKEIDKEALKHYMIKIDRNVRRIQDITSSMRNIADTKGKKIAPFDIEEVLKEMIEKGKKQIGSRNIVVKLTVEGENFLFNGISNEIYRAFFNIYENSLDELIDLSPDYGLINIDLEKQDENIIVTFKDNGRGIPLDIQPNIFDPFFTNKMIGQGIGLGLTYSFNVISFNGGLLELCSPKESVGACFKVTLPQFNS